MVVWCTTSSGNGLAPKRWQAIIWSSVDHDAWSYIDGLMQERQVTPVCFFLALTHRYEVTGPKVTNCPLGDVAVILKVCISNSLYRMVAWVFTAKLLSGESNKFHLWEVNIGSGKGLVLLGNKPLPVPMLAEIYVTIWHHQATMS